MKKKHRMYVRIDAYVELEIDMPPSIEGFCPLEKWRINEMTPGCPFAEPAPLEEWAFSHDPGPYLAYQAELENWQKRAEKYIPDLLDENGWSFHKIDVRTHEPLPVGKERCVLRVLPQHQENRWKLQDSF